LFFLSPIPSPPLPFGEGEGEGEGYGDRTAIVKGYFKIYRFSKKTKN